MAKNACTLRTAAPARGATPAHWLFRLNCVAAMLEITRQLRRWSDGVPGIAGSAWKPTLNLAKARVATEPRQQAALARPPSGTLGIILLALAAALSAAGTARAEMSAEELAMVPGGERENGLGDTIVTAFVSPAQPHGLIWGVGPVLQLPTDTITSCTRTTARPGKFASRCS